MASRFKKLGRAVGKVEAVKSKVGQTASTAREVGRELDRQTGQMEFAFEGAEEQFLGTGGAGDMTPEAFDEAEAEFLEGAKPEDEAIASAEKAERDLHADIENQIDFGDDDFGF